MVSKISLKVACAPLALTVSFTATPAFAQETAEVIESGDAIIVTGTRIRRPDLESAVPVVAITAETIQQSGQTNLTDLLAQTPALFNSETSYDAAGSNARFGGAGVNLLNLRNLGANRTLVLVNGRRHVAGVPGEAAVDINTIPTSLVDRIDTLTGGVSAIYGADGVSGVVNFITKRDFEGLEFTAQNGLSTYGDGSDHLVSVTAGTNFADGRGNIAGSYEFRGKSRISIADRPIGYIGAGRFVQNPDDVKDEFGNDNPDLYDNIFIEDLRYGETHPGGAFALDSSLAAQFIGNGEAYVPGIYLPDTGALESGGSGTPLAYYQGDLQPKTKQHNFNLIGSYELTPSIRAFAEGKYVKSSAYTLSQPTYDLYNYIPADNAFIPQNIRDSIIAGGLSEYGYDDGVVMSRDNFDYGTRAESIKRNLYRGVFGLEGDLTDNAKFEVSYTYGQNDFTFVTSNNRYRDRYFAALDAVDEGLVRDGVANGNIMCRVDVTGQILTNDMLEVLTDDDPRNDVITPDTFTPGANSGCVPLNVFGEGSPSAAALGWMGVDLTHEVSLKQHVANAFVSGDFGKFFELPGGPVQFAFGGEYRKEISDYRPDSIAQTLSNYNDEKSVVMQLALLGAEKGQFDVWEVFGELNVPVLSGARFADRLEFGAAVRVSDYSTIGTTTTWKVDGTYAPIRDIAFRASYSEAVRAPNITELFAPRSGAYSRFSDPCDPARINQGTEYRAANCAAWLGSNFPGFNYGASDQSGSTTPGLVSGNAALNEEKAKTWTAGAVLRPSFIPGLAFSFDWYDIRIEDAINTASLQQTAEFCVDAPTIDNSFCNNITRSSVNGYISNYILRPENVAFFETAGADMTLTYAFQTANLGDFSLRGTVGFLDKFDYLPANGGIVDVDAGETGKPKWVGTGDVTWRKGPVSVNYGLNYVSKQLRFEHDVVAADPDIIAPEYLYHKAAVTHDIRVQFDIDNDSKSFYVGANNFTNEKPSLGSANAPVGYMGRFMYAGVRIKFDKIGF